MLGDREAVVNTLPTSVTFVSAAPSQGTGGTSSGFSNPSGPRTVVDCREVALNRVYAADLLDFIARGVIE
jgi:hypothetical protein